jgi:hypothetical protein
VLLTIGVVRMGRSGQHRPGIGEEPSGAVAPRTEAVPPSTGEVAPNTSPEERPTREMPTRPEGVPPEAERTEEPPPR